MKKGILIYLALALISASAEDAAVPPLTESPKPESAGKESPSTAGPLISTKLKPPKKGRRREQKETEGTEALGRFQADTILKSPYTVDGQSLEVDPD